jgi:glycosyltransferase involved in cell wall biosynthesis
LIWAEDDAEAPSPESAKRIMSRTLVYDLSRLVTRVLHATPNGIDRVDLMLARHFLLHGAFKTQALGLGFTGPRLIPDRISRGAAERVAAAWREHAVESAGSRGYEVLVARLRGENPPHGGGASRLVIPRPRRALHIAHALLRHLPPGGKTPVRSAPRGAIYFNASHFPLEWKRHVAWLDERRDVAPVFWIHDLLPIDRPDWFWGREPALHQTRIELLARRGAAAIVAGASVESRLRWHLERLGRPDLPIFRLRPPTDALFGRPARFDARLADLPYFIVCGTIEPRKNHLLLLRVWRDLVSRYGRDAPKLVVVGKRGWNCAEIVAALEDEALSGHVFEVAGLPTPDYKRLLDHSRALLAPSLAEGFGFPVAEALASGVPVVASDIAPFREQGDEGAIHLDPLSDEAWRRAIADLAFAGAKTPSERHESIAVEPEMENLRLGKLDEFLRRLAP